MNPLVNALLGVLFLGVFTLSKEKQIRNFAEKYHITYPVGKESGIAEALGAKGIPETYFISKEGRTVKIITDPIDHSELISGIEEIL